MNTCDSCGKPKANYNCSICEQHSCKKCAQFLKEGAFSFYETVPEELTHSVYCGSCYDSTVAPEMEKYEELMALAKKVFVFFIVRKRPIPLTRKSKEYVKVAACQDRDETILRLAFFAALAGYNAIMETDVTSEKVRDGSYQTSVWSGSALPADVNEAKLELEDLQNKMYT